MYIPLVFLSLGALSPMSNARGDDYSGFVSFIILDQNSSYDRAKSISLETSINAQPGCHSYGCNIYSTTKEFPNVIGYWTVWTLFKRLEVMPKSLWYVFLEPDTVVVVDKLFKFLMDKDAKDRYFLGYGLVDERPTIIHHFFGYDLPSENIFMYPDFAAGTILSRGVFKVLSEQIPHMNLTSFSIDPKHELARLLLDYSSTRLLSLPDSFCLFKIANCLTYYKKPSYDENCWKLPLTSKNVFFAIKTFSGFHRNRLVVVKRTWTGDLPFVEYFSDVEDPYVPTIALGVNNTERGHCEKTFAILQYFLDHRDDWPDIQWLVLADDDTLLSVPRLLELLTCYDNKQKLIIGERYGFGFSHFGLTGYDYPTGGAGMVFSVSAVSTILSGCSCPTSDSPDDMIIGLCAKSLDVPILHNSAFHQARANDYAKAYLRKTAPISFHKFEDIDPYQDYMEYLHETYRTYNNTLCVIIWMASMKKRKLSWSLLNFSQQTEEYQETEEYQQAENYQQAKEL